MYQLHRVVTIAVEHISKSLLEQSPKTVWEARRIWVVLFLIVQLIPFETIGYCADKDLKIRNHFYSYQQYSSNL